MREGLNLMVVSLQYISVILFLNTKKLIFSMSVKVAVRVRPFNEREIKGNSKCCVNM